jgi:uncharacterized protein YjbI with pentapeptide repeats
LDPKEEKRQRLVRGEPLVLNPALPDELRTVEPQGIVEAVRQGVNIWIENAVLTGPLTLEGLEIHRPLVLKNSRCQDIVFSYGTFEQAVNLEGTVFEGKVFMHAAQFERDLLISGAQFFQLVELSDATIHISLAAVRTVFRDALIARELQVGRSVDFTGAVFEGPVAFFSARMGGDADFRHAVFQRDAAFDRMRIEGNLFCNPVFFNGDARFNSAEILGQSAFHGGQFAQGANFERFHVGGNLYCVSAEYSGEARFIAAEVGGQGAFHGASFGAGALFDRFRVAGELFFNDARFAGEVGFLGAQVGWQVVFDNATFAMSAMFHAMTVGGNLYCVRTRFSKKTEFLWTKVGGQAVFTGATFEQDAWFDGMSVAGLMTFSPASSGGKESGFGEIPSVFGSTARFNGVSIGEQATFKRALFRGVAIFDGMRIKESLSFGGAVFENQAHFRIVKVDGGADFTEAIFKAKWDLRSAEFASLHVDSKIGELPPKGASNRFDLPEFEVDLRGCTYDRLFAYWRPLLDRQRPFDRQPYVHLERALRAMAEDGLADAVYYRLRTTVGNRTPWGLPIQKLWDLFIRVVAGYGVRPVRMALFLLAFPLLAGLAFYFLPGAAQPTGLDSINCSYHGRPNAEETITLTLQTYLPFDLPAPGRWKPTPCGFALWIANSTRVAGWVFIPLAVATFAGVLRYAGRDRD